MPNEVIVLSVLGLISIRLRDGKWSAGGIETTGVMAAGRNLWASILAHGFIDTFGVIDAFFGWSN